MPCLLQNGPCKKLKINMLTMAKPIEPLNVTSAAAAKLVVAKSNPYAPSSICTTTIAAFTATRSRCPSASSRTAQKTARTRRRASICCTSRCVRVCVRVFACLLKNDGAAPTFKEDPTDADATTGAIRVQWLIETYCIAVNRKSDPSPCRINTISRHKPNAPRAHPAAAGRHLNISAQHPIRHQT